MSADTLRARYLGDATATANPARLLVMLYDRLALDLERAEQAIADRDREEANRQLQHAQDIIIELRSTLDLNAGWDGAAALSELYRWLLSELIAANIRQDAAKVSAARQIVEPLREAWSQAATQVA